MKSIARTLTFLVCVFLLPATLGACSVAQNVAGGLETNVPIPATEANRDAGESQITATSAPSATGSAIPSATETPYPSSSPEATSTPMLFPPARGVAAAIPILMYHHLQDLGPNPTALQRDWTVSPENFGAQLDLIQSHGFHTISFVQLVEFFDRGRPLPANPIILTFDDGWRDDFTVAFPALHARGMSGTFFIPTSYVDAGGKSLISWAEALEMQAGGMEFGGHTINHANLKQLNEQDAMRQLTLSKSKLESKLGRPVVALAYPFGAVNAQVMTWVEQAGYSAAVGLCCGYSQKSDMMLNMPRIRISYGDTLEQVVRKLPLAGPAGGTPTATVAP